MDAQTIKRWVAFFGYWLAIFTVCMLIALSVGCTKEPAREMKVEKGIVLRHYFVGCDLQVLRLRDSAVVRVECEGGEMIGDTIFYEVQ